MPEFEVTVCRTLIQTCKVTIRARDEDAANDKATALWETNEKEAKFVKGQDWDLESNEFEVESVDEL